MDLSATKQTQNVGRHALGQMKNILGLVILLTLSTNGFGQIDDDMSYGMTSDQNKEWLAKLSNADKDLQLRLVKGRLFENRQALNPADRLDVPLLIIDGIPIEDNIDKKQKEFLETQLTAETIDIKVVDKEPEGLYINRGFTGIVLIVIKDKRTSKKFRRLK